MILAIRAFRATIFAFSDAIELAIAALASVTDDDAVIPFVAEPVAPPVMIAVNAPGETGANTVAPESVVDVADLPAT
jgi:hypothetical protein